MMNELRNELQDAQTAVDRATVALLRFGVDEAFRDMESITGLLSERFGDLAASESGELGELLSALFIACDQFPISMERVYNQIAPSDDVPVQIGQTPEGE
jgi:hypothetical protein